MADKPAKTSTIDPNHGDAVENIKKKRAAADSRADRTSLRVRLSTPLEETRQGISIISKEA